MIWTGTHVLIKGLAAKNAYQSKNQALRSNKLHVELRDRIASNHTSGEEFRKKLCCIEASQNHVVSVTLNGRSLEQPGLFLELASRQNWTIDGDGLWLEWWPRTRWSLLLNSMIICGNRRSLQKDKHHCNTPPICALCWCGQMKSFPPWRHMKTHLEFAKKAPKRPSDCEKGDSLVWWTSIPASFCGAVFQRQGLRDSPEWNTSSMHRNIEIALMKTQSRAFITSDWAEVFTSNRAMTLPVRQWPSQSLSLNLIKYFWRNLKMCICTHPTWECLRLEEMRRRMAGNCQILICKACHIIPKMTWGCKGASVKYWVKGMKTYAMYLFQFFFFWLIYKAVTILFLLCHYGVYGV